MVVSLCRQRSREIRRFHPDMVKLSQERKVVTHLMKNPQNILPSFFFPLKGKQTYFEIKIAPLN